MRYCKYKTVHKRIHTLADAEGRLLRFIQSGGVAHGIAAAADLLDGQVADAVITQPSAKTTNHSNQQGQRPW